MDTAYYEKIAANISFPTQPFMNGAFQSTSGETIESYNPGNRCLLAKVQCAELETLNQTVQVARNVFERGDWSQLSPSQRKYRLLKFAAFIEQEAESLAVLESLESGKTIKDCIEIDLPDTQRCISWFAQAIDKQYDKISPSDDKTMGMIVKAPIGVVATVLPWNFPLMMMAWKIGPALAAGNSVIVKPAEQTSMTALKIAEIATKAGIPDGVLNVLPGRGETIGKAIGLHPDIDMVSFTGSTQVGRKFLEYSAQSNLKEITLECGGKSPSVVLSDATDFDTIAEQIAFAAYYNSGQNCTANSRVIVHKNQKEALLKKLVEKSKQWTVGNPLNPDNRMGAINSPEHLDKVMGYIAQGQREGATLVLGGQAVDTATGLYIPPTIFDQVTPDMVIAKEEIFGPVMCVMTVESDEQALALANDTEYGLHASVYSNSMKKALMASKRINAGTVSINCYGEGDLSTPFGGFKLSGFGGKDNSLSALDQYTTTKTIWVDMALTS